jgi:transcriptional regulator with XRE-family HTH domain
MKLRVKEICRSQKITQKELADRMGILPESLTRILGDGNPTMKTIQNLARSLNVNIAELFDEEKVEKKINGYVEIDNVIHKIASIKDFEKIYKLLKK